MPAPLQLTGQVFGRLTVMARAGRKGYWRCRCECGREEEIHQRQLTWRERTRTECIVCMRGPCVVCGGPIEWPGTRMMNTCSEACQTAKKRKHFIEHYYRLVERDPEFNRKRWREKAERMEQDPEYAARMRAYWAKQSEKRRQRMQEDPEFREKELAWARDHYQMHREEIIARRKARAAALSDEERERLDAIARAKGREWRRQWREELNQDPPRKEAYLEYLREHRRQAALRRLMAESQKMMDLIEDPDNGNDEQG